MGGGGERGTGASDRTGSEGGADEAVLNNLHKKIQSLPHCHSLFSLDVDEM